MFDAESFDSRRTYLFDTIRSPCSISFEPLRFSISGLRLKQFPELFYSQNSRVLETIVFLALFSRRKVSVYSLRFKNRNHSYFFRKADIKLGEKIICVHLERSELSGLFVLRVNKNNLRIVSVFHRIL